MVNFAVLYTCSFILVLADGGTNVLPKRTKLDGRIVGGFAAQIEDYPWQVSLSWFDMHYCGGAVYKENIIITAAHCVDGQTANDLAVRAGSVNRSKGGSQVVVEKYIKHENYNSKSVDYDVAIIKLKKAIQFSEALQPVVLPAQNETIEDETVVVTSGFGATTEGIGGGSVTLRAVLVPIFNQEQCSIALKKYGTITERMICAGYDKGGKDACQGDSGGPLVLQNKLIGIVSWGNGCARKGFPGVYARVAALRDWIDITVEKISK